MWGAPLFCRRGTARSRDNGSTAGEEVMQPTDGGIPTLLLEPRHRADVGPHPVPLGYVLGKEGERGAALRRQAEDHPPAAWNWVV